MLWMMRRPWMKRLQRAAEGLVPERKRERVKVSMNRQNRWARRVGLRLLTFSFNVLLGSMIVTGAYFLILGIYEAGYLDPTEAMQR
jgi:hypothetical protein